MCDFHEDVPAVAAEHGLDPGILLDGNSRLAMLEHDGILENNGGVVGLRGDDRFLIRAVAAAFDAYLTQSSRAHSKAA